MTRALEAVELLKWERRSIVLTAFGLVGFGAVVGAGTVYWLYVKRKIETLFQLHSVIIDDLQKDVVSLKKSLSAIQEGSSTEAVEASKTASLTKDVHIPVRSSEGNSVLATLVEGTSEIKISDEEGDVYHTASEISESEGELIEDDTEQIKQKKKRRSKLKVADAAEEEEDSVAYFLEKIDKLLDGNIADQHEAFNLLKTNKDKLKNSCGFWWRFAKATHLEAAVAEGIGDKALRKAHIETAFTYAEKALKLDDSSSDAHKWYAITVGSRSEFFPLNDRIKSGFTFKQHVDKAVALNPKDSGCYHLLGRFCLEVSQLTWFERKVAATLFSSPPTATAKEALENFQKAEKIKPFKENRLFMAKCYISMGDNKAAAKWLEAASKMPVNSGSDKTAQEEITQLFQKYKKYLS